MQHLGQQGQVPWEEPSYRHRLARVCKEIWTRIDHGVKVASVLAYSFSRRCSYIAESDAAVKEKAIQVGFVLGK